MRQDCYTNGTSETRVKNFDFDNNTSKNMFSHPYIYYMAGERFQEGEKFDSKNHLLEMRLKSVPQKLNLLMVKYI